MKLLLSSAVVALCLFAQIIRAQEDGDVVETPVAEAKQKQDDDQGEVKLESRGGRSRYGGYRRGDGWWFDYEAPRNYRRSSSSSKRNRGHSAFLEDENVNHGGVRRGSNRGGNNSGRRRGDSNGPIIQNLGVTNKNIRGYTEVLPTVSTFSRERHDVRSQSNSYYRQNSASTVTQNNRRKQTFIHTHLNQVYYHPRHVSHIHKHHHTTFIKQLFPQVTKIKVLQKQKIVQPEKLTIVRYTQDNSFLNKVLPTQVRRATRYQTLKTIREPVRNLGVRNIGTPLAIKANHGIVPGGLRFVTGNRGSLSHNNNHNNELNLGGNFLAVSSRRRAVVGSNEVYGQNSAYELDKRANDVADTNIEVAVAPVAETPVEKQPTAEVKPAETLASDILEQRSASSKVA